jgi:hypothetical protein
MLRHTIRASRLVLGAVLILFGAVLALPLVPGPGVVIMFIGLGVLGTEFEWARRLQARLQDGLRVGVRRAMKRAPWWMRRIA